VAKDEVEAVKWFRKLLTRISPRLKTIWASATAMAEAWRKDEVEAVKWFARPPSRITPRLNSIWATAIREGQRA